MSKISINRLTNANIYLDGGSMLGRAEEVTGVGGQSPYQSPARVRKMRL
jgi:hypothetical protein